MVAKTSMWGGGTVVYDAMSLARFAGDCVRKEYKVDPVVRASNGSGKALDIVYIRQQQVVEAPQKLQQVFSSY